MKLSEYAQQEALKKMSEANIVIYKGVMFIVVLEGIDNDPSLMLLKRIGNTQPVQQVAIPSKTDGKVMDLSKRAPVDNKPELSFKLASEKAKEQSKEAGRNPEVPIEERLEKAKKAAKKAKKEKKNEKTSN